MAQDSESRPAPVSILGKTRIGKKRMKMKPTRFTGWVGKNLADSYPHAGAGQQQHMAQAEVGRIMSLRIEASSATVKRRAGRKPSGRAIFLHLRSMACILLLIRLLRPPGDVYEHAEATAGNGAVGCFLFQASRGEFAGRILRRSRAKRRRHAGDREGDESFRDNFCSSTRSGDGTRSWRAGENLYRAGGVAVCGTSYAGDCVRFARCGGGFPTSCKGREKWGTQGYFPRSQCWESSGEI